MFLKTTLETSSVGMEAEKSDREGQLEQEASAARVGVSYLREGNFSFLLFLVFPSLSI